MRERPVVTTEATLAVMGDVMLGRGVNEEIAVRAPESFWGDVLPVLRSADAALANLECAITEHKQRWWKTPKVFYFGADPAAVEALRVANIKCVSLANNHTLDYEAEGLLETLQRLDSAGILHAGAGRSEAEAAAPAVMDVAGVKVGVISFTDNEPPFAAGPYRPGANYIEISDDPATLARVNDSIAQARQAGAQIIIVSLHWGPNMVPRPLENHQAFAAAVIDRGVDLIHGHSAHIFQGVQVRGRGLVLYDTGDFLDDYAVDPELRNDWSFVFLVQIDSEGLRALRMIPLRLRYARVDLARGAEFETIRERMLRLSAELGTHLRKTSEGLELIIR
ncbi:MAG: CapA family protein [Armatimonadetes bacterium]|nr:CapA family protein [Armatimonadota bacterium]